MDNDYKAVIQRRNTETFLIEYGVGVLSIWRYEGREVFIYSPGLFCGVGATLILPEDRQQARIWNAQQLR